MLISNKLIVRIGTQQWDPWIGKFPTKVSVTQQGLQSKVINFSIISNILIKYFYDQFWSSFIYFLFSFNHYKYV